MKLDHIAVEVSDLEAAVRIYRALGFPFGGTQRVEAEGVEVAFFEAGEAHIELIAPFANEGVRRFLEKRGPGVHHLAFRVPRLEDALRRLKDQGFEVIPPEIRRGAYGRRVAFLHPRSTSGVLIELIEEVE